MSDPIRDRLRKALVANAWELSWKTGWSTTPAMERLANCMRTPRPGDLVYETSTACVDQHVGILICTREEFVPFDEPGSNGGDGYTDRFTYIETLDGELQRWNNCEFKRIIEEPHFRLEKDDVPNVEWVAEAMIRHKLAEAP